MIQGPSASSVKINEEQSQITTSNHENRLTRLFKSSVRGMTQAVIHQACLVRSFCIRGAQYLSKNWNALMEKIWGKTVARPSTKPQVQMIEVQLEINQIELHSTELNQIKDGIDPLKKKIDLIPTLFFHIRNFSKDLKSLIDLRAEILQKLKRIESLNTANQEEVLQLKNQYEGLLENFQSSIYYQKDNVKKIFEGIAEKMYASFTPAPNHVHEFLEDRKAILSLFKDISLGSLGWIENMGVSGQMRPQETPLSLNNMGNSCYLASALQVMFNFDETRDRLFCPLENIQKEIGRLNGKEEVISEETAAQKEKLQDQLVHLCKVHEGINQTLSYSDYLAALEEQPNMLSLRSTLFHSKLHPEFLPQDIGRQMDPSFVIELLMSEILGYGFTTQRVISSDQIAERIFYSKQEPNYFLSLPIEANGKSKDAYSLEDLVENFFNARTEQDAFSLNPKDGIATGSELVEAGLSDTVRVDHFHNIMRLRTLPDVMAIQIRRFNSVPVEQSGQVRYQEIKNATPIRLPEDGIVDLNEYYGPIDSQESSPLKAQYEIMGYITHLGGSASSGHYVSYVKKGNRFWFCNDMGSPRIQEISKQEFYGQRQSYMLMLRRIK